ncbi:hypothetical protein STCU_02075 [Strigomonas culicis]|uniref:START domain-containing protein n=1 Tax=Strigomonas culicis TaxID=28005 RepID=S9UA02_9TRYP|nr:hypothetical protein STCU_06679 [Strigomonas culicis]EPY33691.1 hypothetical protein STCU_02075 [Strigomonas culicis]|eukprot:EPY25564.1 hypothetical protein STCU_06679 [Strigomonas culicis]
MLKFVSSVGDAAYSTASKSGLADGSNDPPYPCALPFTVIPSVNDCDAIEGVLEHLRASFADMQHGELAMLNSGLRDKKRCGWSKVDYKDPEGDLHLLSRPPVGPYIFARATMTLMNVHPVTILNNMMSQDMNVRRRYSANLVGYELLGRNPKMPSAIFHPNGQKEEKLGNDNYYLEELARQQISDWHIEYNHYDAPPPVSGRDFICLVEKRYIPEEETYCIYGTSIDLVDTPYRKSKVVRGAVLFGWEYTVVNGNTLCTYVSCMNPNGWAPTFLVSWMKTAIAKEFTGARRLLYNEADRESVMRWYAERQQAKQAAAAAAAGGAKKKTVVSAFLKKTGGAAAAATGGGTAAAAPGRYSESEDDNPLAGRSTSAYSHATSLEFETDSELDRQMTEEVEEVMQHEDRRQYVEEDLIIIE